MSSEINGFEIFISDELKSILAKFQSESVVAQMLLCRVIDSSYITSTPPNYIGLSKEDKSKISYIPYDRISNIETVEYWKSPKRVICRPGSFVSKIFKNIPDREVENFTKLIRSQLSDPFIFKIVKGEDIRKFYSHATYSSGGGSLNSSCMRHDGCQEFFNIYVENPEHISMLIMVDPQNSKILGRALLWDNKIMDRIYTINDEEFQYHFRKWATDNSYLHKSNQNWYDTINFEQSGKNKQELKLNIKLNKFKYRRYPYIDTFKFLDITNGNIYNYKPEDSTNIKILCAPDGNILNSDYLKFDDIARVYRNSGECVYLAYLNINTYSPLTVWSDINNTHILAEHSKYDKEIGENIFCEEYDHLNNKEAIESKKKYIMARNEIIGKARIKKTPRNLIDNADPQPNPEQPDPPRPLRNHLAGERLGEIYFGAGVAQPWVRLENIQDQPRVRLDDQQARLENIQAQPRVRLDIQAQPRVRLDDQQADGRLENIQDQPQVGLDDQQADGGPENIQAQPQVIPDNRRVDYEDYRRMINNIFYFYNDDYL